MISMASTHRSFDIETTIHGTCRQCHHYHHARSIKLRISRRRTLREENFLCDLCNLPWFSIGGIYWHKHLVSQETIVLDDEEKRTGRARYRWTCSERPPDLPTSRLDLSHRRRSNRLDFASNSDSEEHVSIHNSNDLEGSQTLEDRVSGPPETTGPMNDLTTPITSANVPHSNSSEPPGPRNRFQTIRKKIKQVGHRLQRIFRKKTKTSAIGTAERPSVDPLARDPVVQDDSDDSDDSSYSEPNPEVIREVEIDDAEQHNSEDTSEDSPSERPFRQPVSLVSSDEYGDDDDGDDYNDDDIPYAGPSTISPQNDNRVPQCIKARRRKITLRRKAERPTIECDCKRCDCTQNGNCPSESIKVSIPQHSNGTPSTRSTETEPQSNPAATLAGVGEWIEGVDAPGMTTRPPNYVTGIRTLEPSRFEQVTDQSPLRRFSGVPTECSGTTAVSEEVELLSPPPGPIPPINTNIRQLPPLRSRAPHLSQLSMQSLQPPGLETLGEISSASENSQDQRQAFADSAVESENAANDAVIPDDMVENVGLPESAPTVQQLESVNNGNMDQGANNNHLDLPGHGELTTSPANSNTDSGISVGPSSASQRSPTSSLPHPRID